MDIVQDDDLAQSFGLARRRHAELCRQNQMFNARNRILGVRRSLVPTGKGAGGRDWGRGGAGGSERWAWERRRDESLE